MRRVLLAIAAVCIGLHWQQAWGRCRRAEARSQAARQELAGLEESLKEWPDLRRQAQRLPPPKDLDPTKIQHQDGVKVSILSTQTEEVYQMRLAGPRSAVTKELLQLTGPFCLRSLDLKADPGGQIRGQAILQVVP